MSRGDGYVDCVAIGLTRLPALEFTGYALPAPPVRDGHLGLAAGPDQLRDRLTIKILLGVDACKIRLL